MSFSVKLGNFLYKNAFPLYNFMYPIFKKRQDVKELNLIRSVIKPGNNVLDIGANIGFYSKILSKITGNKGKVIAFEPDSTNYRYLKNNIKGFKNITPVAKAVSENSDKIKIYTSNFLNVDHRTYPVDDYNEVIEIDATSIDDYVKGEFKVDFIKMDIQGYESSALKGMINTLNANSQIKILTEFWPYGLNKAGVLVKDFIKQIEELGLNIYLIKGDHLTEFDKSINYQDWPDTQYKNLLLSKSTIKIQE